MSPLIRSRLSVIRPARELVGKLVAGIRAGAFWTAIALPFIYFGVLLHPEIEVSVVSIGLALFIHGSVLILGHHHDGVSDVEE